MSSVPRWLLVGMTLMTFGVHMSVEGWHQQALRQQIHGLEAEWSAAREAHLAARARFQCSVLDARPVTAPASLTTELAVVSVRARAAPRAGVERGWEDSQ